MSRSGIACAILCLVLLSGSAVGAAEKYSLQQKADPDRVLDVTADLDVSGRVEVATTKDKAVGLKLAVEGEFAYAEKRLASSLDVESLRSVRYYRTAKADIVIQEAKSSPTLRPHLRLIAAQGRREGPVLFSPGGPLTREELDLLEVPADSLVVGVLLPAKPVSVGQVWRLPDEAAQVLLGLDAVGESEVQCTLAEVKERIARVDFSGKVSGADVGASTRLNLSGHCLFDLDAGFVTEMELAMKEKRSVGHVTPGLDVDAHVVLRQKVAGAPAELAPESLASIPLEARPVVTQLEFQSPDSKLRFYHDRNWYVFYHGSDVTVLRYLDRGELVAQCNISAVPPAAPGSRTDPKQFERDVRKALGDRFQRFVQTGDVPMEDGLQVYRLSAVGNAQGLPVQWNYYLVTGPQGDQAVFVFTFDGRLAERFGSSDLGLVGTVEFLSEPAKRAAPQTAGKDENAQTR